MKIINGFIPLQNINGSVYYIDCDATSFRCMLNILTHGYGIDSINVLGLMDFKLLQRTKDYLMIHDRNLDSAIDNYVRKEKEKDKELQELRDDLHAMIN